MSFFSDLFKSKPGGTTVGNLLRGGAKIAKSAASGIPGVGPIIAKLPIGEGLMMKQPTAVKTEIVSQITKAAMLPAQTRAGALSTASATKAHIFNLTGNAGLADKIGQAAFEAAQSGQVQGTQINDFASFISTQVVNDGKAETSTTKQTIKDVLNGALKGAAVGAGEVLAETPAGKEVAKDMTMYYINKYLPYALVAVIAFLLFKNKKK